MRTCNVWIVQGGATFSYVLCAKLQYFKHLGLRYFSILTVNNIRCLGVQRCCPLLFVQALGILNGIRFLLANYLKQIRKRQIS